MPIRPELRKFYGREWKTVTRPRILARAGNKCEQCGVPNHTDVRRVRGCWLEILVSWANGIALAWRDQAGRELAEMPLGRQRNVRVVLTVAHLNHAAGDDRDQNLAALCQYCHLHYDAKHHAETRATRKDAARPLLREAAS